MGSLWLLSDWSASGCVAFALSKCMAWFYIHLRLDTFRLSSFLLKPFLCLWISIASRCKWRDSSGYLIRPLFHQKESCDLDFPGHVWPQKIFHVFYAPLSCLYGMFSRSAVGLVAVAGDSVYSTRCFRIPFIFYRIQVFVNFLVVLYIVLMSCFSESYQCNQLLYGYFEGKHSFYQSSINRLFVARMWGSRYLFIFHPLYGRKFTIKWWRGVGVL